MCRGVRSPSSDPSSRSSSVASPSFLTPLNLTNLLERQSGILIIAAASTLVLIAGGIDLSVGATYMLASVVCAHFVLTEGTWVGVIAALAAGLVIGLLNGVISTYLRVSPLIATLAMSFIISGATMLVQQGRLLNLTSDDYDDFKAIAQERFLGLPASVWIAAIIIIVTAPGQNCKSIGRALYLCCRRQC
ncbi:MAG TPA: hypothetical protein PK890_01745 [Terrimesophilobacter sp.]|nr:hypothetical protein [Terrimesophilobacter sp.]